MINKYMNIVDKIKEKHQSKKYDYSLVEYKNSRTPIKIICPVHGVFEKTPYNMTRSHGCNKCYENNKTTKALTTEEFIKRARDAHGDKYDYSLTVYTTIIEKVKIICPVHGEYEQNARSHLEGKHCKKCSLVTYREKRTHTTEKFIERAKGVHGDRYDYSLVEYKDQNVKVKIICPVHGEFKQLPNNHLNYGCGDCPSISTGVLSKRSNSFIERATTLHDGKYDYSKVDYQHMHTKVKIICPVHGVFEQRPTCHIAKYPNGCPKCTGGKSKAEETLRKYIEHRYGGVVISNDRQIIKPYEIDIVLPELKIAIEYCGLYWHSNKFKDSTYHLKKLEACNKAGYRLITIFEDEWAHHETIVKHKLLCILNAPTGLRTYARKCKIDTITSNDVYTKFLNNNHVQGEVNASVKLGLYHEGILVAVMGLRNTCNSVYDLNSFASSYNVVGGFSKLLSYFKRNYDWSEIYTFADRRWSEGDLYLKTGFEHVHNTQPNYFYIKKDIRESRHKYMKHKLKTLLSSFDSSLSETQNMENAGINRIYDCGNMKFVMKKPCS